MKVFFIQIIIENTLLYQIILGLKFFELFFHVSYLYYFYFVKLFHNVIFVVFFIFYLFILFIRFLASFWFIANFKTSLCLIDFLFFLLFFLVLFKAIKILIQILSILINFYVGKLKNIYILIIQIVKIWQFILFILLISAHILAQ